LECGSLLPLSASELARAISALAPSHGRQAGLQKAAASCRTPKRLRRTHFHGGEGSPQLLLLQGFAKNCRDASLRSERVTFFGFCPFEGT
jgi:hypothetical protein